MIFKLVFELFYSFILNLWIDNLIIQDFKCNKVVRFSLLTIFTTRVWLTVCFISGKKLLNFQSIPKKPSLCDLRLADFYASFAFTPPNTLNQIHLKEKKWRKIRKINSSSVLTTWQIRCSRSSTRCTGSVSYSLGNNNSNALWNSSIKTFSKI